MPLTANCRSAVLGPAAWGVKKTKTEQAWPALRALPQFVVKEKSEAFAPWMLKPPREKDDVPVFVTVVVCGALETWSA